MATSANPGRTFTFGALIVMLGGCPTRLVAQDPPPSVTLAEAHRLAIEHQVETVSAAAAVTAAEARVLRARGAWLPTISVNSGYLESATPRAHPTTGRVISDSYSAEVASSWNLFAGGSRISEGRAASAALRSAGAQELAQRSQTLLQTTQVFHAAAAAEALLSAARDRVTRAQSQLDLGEARVQLGAATRSDVLRARLELGNARLGEVEAEAHLLSTRLALGQEVGMAGPVRPAEAELPAAAPVLPALEELLARAETTAPSVVAARAEAESRSAERIGSWTGYLPSVSVAGAYDWASVDFPPSQGSWKLQLQASLPLLEGFQREAAIREATAMERLARAEERAAVIAIRSSVAEAVKEIQAAEARSAIAADGVAIAEEDLSLMEERYRLGQALMLDLQTSQVALTQARVTLIQARQTLADAIAVLDSLLGGADFEAG